MAAGGRGGAGRVSFSVDGADGISNGRDSHNELSLGGNYKRRATT